MPENKVVSGVISNQPWDIREDGIYLMGADATIKEGTSTLAKYRISLTGRKHEMIEKVHLQN